MRSIKSLVAALGVGLTVLIVFLALWFGHDLWSTFVGGWKAGLAPAEFNVRQARALKNAQTRRVKGPETITVYVPRDESAVRQRHGVAPIRVPASGGGIGAPAPSGEPVEATSEGPYLLDMKDLFAEGCGDTYEVGCWLYADGHGAITIIERPRTVIEKGVDAVVGGVKALHGWPHTVEVGGEVDLEHTSDWRAWSAYEPFQLGHVRPRLKVEGGSVDGVVDTKLYAGIVARFDLGKR